jgi:hypothetical protein
MPFTSWCWQVTVERVNHLLASSVVRFRSCHTSHWKGASFLASWSYSNVLLTLQNGLPLKTLGASLESTKAVKNLSVIWTEIWDIGQEMHKPKRLCTSQCTWSAWLVSWLPKKSHRSVLLMRVNLRQFLLMKLYVLELLFFCLQSRNCTFWPLRLLFFS